MTDFDIELTVVPENTAPSEGAARRQSFLQAPFWGGLKSLYGWTVFRFRVTLSLRGREGEAVFPVQVLVRRFLHILSLAYVPMGPDPDFSGLILPEETPRVLTADFYAGLLAKTAAALRQFLPGNVYCIRFDPPWNRENVFVSGMRGTGLLRKKTAFTPELRKAAGDVQPPDTVLLDLRSGAEAVFAAMKPKWRYNIRLSEKKGVQTLCFRGPEAQKPAPALVPPGFAGTPPSPLDVFYTLYEETAARDGIAIHGKSYYASLFSVCAGSASGADLRLYAAVHEGDVLAAVITLFYGTQAVYLYGASCGKKRALMPAYALQWRAIRDAGEAGCSDYDFYGIPPSDDVHHPMYGLYRFKTGFGGNIVHRCGSLDAPYKPFLYRFLRLAEGVRSFWFKSVRKAFRRAGKSGSGNGGS